MSKAKEEATQKKLEELDDSSEEEEDVKLASKVGYVEMKNKKTWRAVYCIIVGSTLYYYKNAGEPTFKGKVELADLRLDIPARGEKKNYSFVLLKGEESVFVGACSSDPELDQWTKAFKESTTKAPAGPPASSGKASKKQSLGQRAKKKAASKTATSALGKKVMKAIVNEETTTLLNALKKIVRSESGSPKKAEDLEKNIIKIAVKAFLLIENKVVTADDFLVADKPLREAFELMVKVFNGRGRVKDDKITEALKRVESHLKKAEEVITNLLAPHLTARNMLRVSAAFGCVANEKFLNTVFRDPELEGDLDKLMDAMEYYTQFHYH